MNKYLYHVIFNERRGQCIVVGERVSGGAHGGSVTINFGPGVHFMERRRATPLLRPIALVLRSAFGVTASIAVPAYAQIIADPNAPGRQRPTVLQTANGVVQVNIQTPSQAGVSRNTYTQFDVTRGGAVLNNSRNSVQTQVGGWVQGNPWLAQGSARVILNEVNSSNPSQLRGALEVAGERAEIVIANPSGIDVDGAGFINANRVTLTTGVPRLQDGNLEGILVQQGRVSVSGRGLDAAQADYAQILARAVTVNANIWAKDLRIVTGANEIDATAAATPAGASGSAPAFALDVAQLGGMYAGHITLIGTEAGMGVRNAGTIAATSGNLVLNTNGWLTNSGTIVDSAAKASADIAASGDITNSGTMYAAGDINVTSRGDIASTGLIAAQNDASVHAAGATSRIDGGTSAVFASGLMADGTMLGSGDLSLSATTSVSHHGTALGGAAMQVSGSEVDLSHATLTSDQISVVANTANLDASGSVITAKGLLVLNSAGALDTNAAKVVAEQLRIGTRDWSNVGGEVLQSGSGDTDISLTARDGTIDNTSGRIAVNSANLTLGAGTLLNTGGGIEHAGTGTLAVRAQTFDDQHGTIIGNGMLDIAVVNLDHRGAVTSAKQVIIEAASLDNQGGHISQVGAGVGTIRVSGSLANSAGTIESNGDVAVSAGALDNSGGRITAIGGAVIGAGAALDNANGLIAAGVDLAVQGGSVDNSHGTLQAQGGDATVRVNDLNNASGSVFAAGRLDTVASNLSNTGTLYAGGDQNLAVSGIISNSGVIAARGSTTVNARSLSSDAASLLGAGLNADGSFAQAGDLSITTGDALAAHGQNQAAGRTSLQGADVDLSGSRTGGANIALNASVGDVGTSGAVVATAGTLAITATAEGHGLVNSGGTVSGGQLDLQVANLRNQQGTLIQSGTGDSSIAMRSPIGVLDNTGGRIAVNANHLNITAATLANVDGHIDHAGTGTFTIKAANLDDERGNIASNGMLALTADMLGHDGATTSAGGMSVHAGSISNRGGHLLQAGTGGMTLDVTNHLDNAAGQIAADGALDLWAGAIENNRGQITSSASAQLSSGGLLDNSDGVLAAGHSLAVAGGAIFNTLGTLQAGDALTLDVAAIRNNKGILSAGTDLTAHVDGDLSNDALLYAGRNQVLNLGGTLTNTGSIAAQGDTTIVAASVDSGAGALLGAGIRADGKLAQSGSLNVQATGNTVATGQNLAAGDASLSGSSVDVRGGDTAGGNVTLAAGSGDVHAAGANVRTAGTLSVTAGHLDNVQGDLSAGQLSLQVANLDNTRGTLLQSGTGDANITLSAPDGRLDNTSGHITANSANLTLGAGTLINTDGSIEHAGVGTLAIRAGKLAGERGEIAGNGVLDITAGAIDHRGGAMSANQIAITAGSLDNHGGHIAQLGTGLAAITVSASLDNGAGAVESNGDASVLAGSLDNSGGRITVAGSAAIGAQVSLNNTDGLLVAGTHLAVDVGNLDNSRGSLQAQGGDATVRVGDLNNMGGSVYAAGKLDTVAANVANTGSMYAGGDQHLEASGAVTNSGVIAAHGNTTVNARSLSGDAGSLLGAGVKADGTLVQTGDLSVTTTETLAAHGQNLAAGGASLQGATVDLSGSQTGGASIALRANAGDVTTSGATVATGGVLAIAATADGHGLVNSGGALSGAQLDVRVANLDNRQGTLNQSGTADTSITMSSPSGVLDNSGGQIAVNANSLNIAAATLANVDGHIEHAGTGGLNITAGTFNDERGSVASNGTLALTADVLNHNDATMSAAGISVHAGMLSNRGGHLLLGGAGSMALEVTGQVDNAGGEIAGEGLLSLQAGTIDNTHGHITSGDSAIVSSVGQLNNRGGVVTAAHSLAAAVGAVDNTGGALQAGDAAFTLDAASMQNIKGVLSAGTDLTAHIAGDLSNDSVVYAGRDQSLHAGGALINTGSIAAQGNTTIVAASVDSGAGGLLGAGIRADGSLAQSGALTVLSSGSLLATGQNLAAGSASLSGLSVDVRGSDTAGGNVTLAAGSGDVHTAGANVSTLGTLGVTAGHLDNALGNLSAGQLFLHVANLDNTHGTVIQTGTGDADVTLSAPDGRLDNTSGHIAVNSANLTLGAGTLVNTDGSIEHAGAGTLAIRAGALDGAYGQITGNGALDISAGGIDHRGATMSANQIAITAASLDNHGGHIAQLGTGGGAITVSGNLDNGAGAIESNGDALVHTGALDNSGGRITVAGSTAIGAHVSLNNTDGLLAAGTYLALEAGNLDNSHGSLQAQGGDATVRVGDLNNMGGSVYAAGKLDTVAANVANTGSMYAGGDQYLEASGTVTNSGVIAAHGNTTVNARSLSSEAGSLLGAGVNADGTLVQTGDLSVMTTDTLAAHGQNLAAGRAILQGAAVDLSGSQTGGASVALRANTGDITTRGATVATSGTLAIAATGDGHGLVNAGGTLSGEQLDVRVANLDNRQGTLNQSGTADTSIAMSSPSGVLDNTGGRIAVNANSLSITAATLANVDGRIEHAGAGTLNIAAGTFNDQRGSVASNGALVLTAEALNHNDATTFAAGVSVHAGMLSNRGGHLVQGGAGSMAFEVTGLVDNAGGEIAGGGSLDLHAGALENSHGRITSGDSAIVSSAGQLNNSNGVLVASHSLAVTAGATDNTGGAIQTGDGALTLAAASVQNNNGLLSAGTDLTARIVGNLANDSVVYAGRDQSLNVGGALTNTGSIAAQGNTTIIAASVDSGPGGLLGAGIRPDGNLAQSGSLTVQSSGMLLATGRNLAAGNASLSGASVDVRGSDTAGGNLTLAAASGDVHTAGANVSTLGTLSVTAGHLDNALGNLNAGQLSLHVANLDNTRGTLLQTGTGDADITLSAPDGRLDNTSGHIAANSANLTLGAGTLINTDGSIEHAGAGTLAIRAGALDGERGQITGNGALDLSATTIDHRDGAMFANQVAIAAASFDNRGGHIAQLGTGVGEITVGGSLDNGAGTIESNSDVSVDAGSLDNSGGRITAAGSAAIGAHVSLNNTDGLLAAGTHMAVEAGNLDNSRGSLQAQGGDATVHVGNLTNMEGSVYATGKLDTVAANVVNSGSMYASGEQRMQVNGAFTNSGVIAAQGKTTVNARSLSSEAGSLLGAGVKADGTLAQGGDLSVATTDMLAAHGQNLAAGRASLQGASVDLSGSQTGGASIALRANTGDVTTSGAAVETSGMLAITATTDGHGLVNAGGTLGGAQLDVRVANLDNRQGTLTQSGTGDSGIGLSPNGVLDNTGGRIALNANDLTVRAGTLTNVGGHIEHAGTGRFDLTAREIHDQHGEIIGNGVMEITTGTFDHREAATTADTLVINAGSLDNSQGIIVQKGSANTSIRTSATLNNSGGTIASNGNTTISASALNNVSGTLTSAGAGNLAIQVGGAVDNSQGGLMAAAGDATVSAGSLLNQSGMISSGRTLTVDSLGAIRNAQGAIMAHGNTSLTAAQLTNSLGTVVTELGNISIQTSGVTDNDSGVIQAGSDLTLINNGLSNAQANAAAAGGSIVGRNVDIDSNGQALSNHLGTIASSQNLSVNSGTIDNAGGLMQSGGALLLDTHGGDLNNSDAGTYAALHRGTPGGIVSGGEAQIRVGAWNNAGGFFGTGGVVDAHAAGQLDNTASGQIVSGSDLSLTASGVDNRGGQVQSLGSLTVKATAGNVDNSGSLMRSGATLDVSASGVDNSNTQGTGAGLEGRNVVLTTSTLNNDHGAIRADENADIHSGISVVNTQGLISAGDTLRVGPAFSGSGLSIANSGGTLISGNGTDIKAASMSGAGHVLSLGDLALDLSGDFTQAQGGGLIANRTLSLKVAGDIDNSGKLSAGSDLAIESRNVENSSNGEISSGGVTQVTTAGSLHNRGLIDGSATRIDAGTVDNVGTGRIYGDNVSIAAGVLNNDVEAGIAGTIAARSRLDIGAQTLNNREHALIFSGGDLAVGGALDANRAATGRADVVTNASASIEATGNLVLNARQVNNLNNHFATELLVTGTESIREYSAKDDPTHYSPYEAHPILANNEPGTVTVLHIDGQYGDHDDWTQYDYTRATQETVITSSDPGRIAAGGMVMIGADGVLNDNSRITAGGLAIVLARVSNTESSGQKITSDVGTAKITWREHHHDGPDQSKFRYVDYQPPAMIELSKIDDSRIDSFTATVDRSAPSHSPVDGVSASTSSAGLATATVNATTIVKASASSDAPSVASGNDASSVSAANAPTSTDIGDGSARLVSIDSATGERASVSGSTRHAIPAGPMPVEHSRSEIATSEVDRTTGTAQQDHADSLDADSARPVSIGTAKGEHAAVAVAAGQANSADAMDVGFGSRHLAMIEVGPSAGLDGENRAAGFSALPQRAIDLATSRAVSAATGAKGAGSAPLAAPGTPAVTKRTNAVEVDNVDGIDPVGQTQAPGVTQSPIERSAGGAPTVRTIAPSSQLPGTSLFQVHPSPSAGYLIETDPRFASYQQWTGSDYMITQMKMDPALTQKRLGDGFYEQKLVRDQVAQLTGQRFLGDYTSDDEQYCGLMDAGIEYAKTLNLRPGVALTAEQMAAITKDMVWLVAQDVTLADGTVQKVLAPQVYVASHEQDLTGAGAVISGRDVKVASTGNLTNTGSIFARNTTQLVAENINNLGGRIHAESVLASAKTDINNTGGTISAGHEMILTAGRDINVETTTRSASSSVGGNQFSRTTIDRIGSLSVTGAGGTLVASAGRDINLVAAKIDNAGTDGNTLLDAGRNLNLGTVTTASSNSLTWDPVRYRKESSSTEVGTVIQGAGAITLKAGTDINLRAASVDAGKDLTAIAGNNLNIVAGVGTSKFDEASQTTSSGFLHHETITTRNTLDGTSAIGSALGGATVNLAAGNDLKVVGSSVVGDDNVNLVAKHAISIEAATNQSHETHYVNVKESGLLSGGGFGISFGKRTTTTNQDQNASTQSGQARSTVGSIAGNVTMRAGDSVKIAGTDLQAGNDINVLGKSVSITPGVDDVTGKFTSKMTQDALTLSVGGSVVNAIQNAQSMSSAAGQTSSGRLKALAVASAVMTAKDTADDLAKNGPSVKVSLTVGHSESESTELTASSTHGGSVLTAGNNINIVATGGDKASNIDIVGSDVRAKGDVLLAADNQVNLLAAQDTESQHSQSKSWSASVGVSAELSSSKPKIGYTASTSASRGNIDGEGATQVNSHVSAGNQLTIDSGGDTNLKGAVVSASQVVADIKGNLNIESLQDTATLEGKRQSASVSGTVGAVPGLSANVSQSKVHNDYASVQEQSGIRTGDGGFQVQVAGNTDLKGGVISSTEQAIKDGHNSLATATLSFTDIQNRDSTSASGVSLGVNVGKNQSGDTFSPSMAPGVGQISGGHDSVTRSGISGATLTVGGGEAGQAVANLNRDVSTGKDTAQALTKSWTGAKALDEVGAQMQITAAAMPRLAKEIGTFAETKVAELKTQGNAEEAAKWEEGGVYRVAAHAALGAMGGGLGGAVGATAAAEAAPSLGRLQNALQDKLANAGLSNDAADLAAKLIAGGTAAAISGMAGGAAGAATGLNAEVNNRQLHPGDYAVATTLAKRSGGKYTETEILDALRYSGLKDKTGNTIVAEGTRETFVNLTNIATGASLQDTIKADPTMAFAGVPGNPTVLLEQAPVRPSNELMSFITANTGGTASPYVMTPGKTYSSSSSLPAAPEGTTRVTMAVDGAAYFPLIADCPAASCTNGDPIAYGIQDSGTRAYLDALGKKDEKYFNIATTALGVGGSLLRGVGVATDFVTAELGIFQGTEAASLVNPAIANSVWHSTRTTGAAAGILENGIDPAFLNANSRFGSAFYVAEQPSTSLAEMAHYGVDPTTGIRFSVEQAGLKVLDLTNPQVASAWGYRGGSISSATQKIGTDAFAQGYNVIRYGSERAVGGTNLAILNNFNDVLRPVMVAPVGP